MHFPDLSPYEYTPGEASGALNVGWLEHGHEFRQGAFPRELLAVVLKLTAQRVNGSRGFHVCTLCPKHLREHAPMSITVSGQRYWLGSSEIRVIDADGTHYLAPSMLYHYITVHGYLPPPEFVAALRNYAEASEQ